MNSAEELISFYGSAEHACLIMMFAGLAFVIFCWFRFDMKTWINRQWRSDRYEKDILEDNLYDSVSGPGRSGNGFRQKRRGSRGAGGKRFGSRGANDGK